MLKKTLLSSVLAVSMLAGLAPAFAAPLPSVTAGQPVMTTAERNQLAAEAGLLPQQAAKLTLNQLTALKYHRDGDDGAYANLPPPVPSHS